MRGCIGCEYIEMCESGCQMISAAINGETATKDPLYVGPNNVKKHFKLVTDDKIYEFIKNKGNFSVRDTLRFREEIKKPDKKINKKINKVRKIGD